MPKLATDHTPAVFAVMMSCVMAFIVTCVVTFINTGAGAGFALRWMRAFLLAWPVACICILIFGNRVRRIATRLTTN
jgi:hypothetical protein